MRSCIGWQTLEMRGHGLNMPLLSEQFLPVLITAPIPVSLSLNMALACDSCKSRSSYHHEVT